MTKDLGGGPKQKGRFLLFPPDDFRVVLPFGAGARRDTCTFEVTGTNEHRKVIARIKGSPKSTAKIHPPYRVTERMKLGGKFVAVRFWLVISDLDRLRARQLIEREHYLMPTSRGLFLVCGVEEDPKQKAPKIIGVAVLDTLMHGNPAKGRSLFATDALGSDAWLNWPRNRIVGELSLAWASRFAVHSNYHGNGIGTRLASHLKVIARQFRLPSADFIEVITTEPKESPSQGNFLVRAGYTRMSTPLKSSPLRRLNKDTGYIDSVSARKYYYYADLRND